MKETNRKTSIPSISTRSYSDIRKIIRHAYLYGTFSIADYINVGMVNTKSLRQLAYLWSNISTYFKMNRPNETVIYDGKKKEKKDGVSRRIFIDSFLQDGSFIASTYKHFSLTKNDVLYYLYFLFSFGKATDDNPYMVNFVHDKEGEYTIPYDSFFSREDMFTVMEELWLENKEILDNKEREIEDARCPFSRPTLNRFLEDLCDQGILIKTKIDAKIKYKLSEDVIGLDIYSEETCSDMLDNLLSANQFFCNTMPFVVPGYYINDKLKLMKTQVNIGHEEEEILENIFCFSKSNYHNMVDDDIVWTLLEYIDSKKPISYSYGMYNGKKKEHNVLPMKIITDNVYGRQYLFGYGYPPQKSYIFHRIDFIDDIECFSCSKIIPNSLARYVGVSNDNVEDVINVFCDYHLQSSWNVAPFTGKKYPVRIIFDFSDCPDLLYDYLIEKVYNNPMGMDCIIKQDEYHMVLNVEISSQEEIIPWLHSFTCYAVVDESINSHLYEIMKKQSTELAKLYEII